MEGAEEGGEVKQHAGGGRRKPVKGAGEVRRWREKWETLGEKRWGAKRWGVG